MQQINIYLQFPRSFAARSVACVTEMVPFTKSDSVSAPSSVSSKYPLTDLRT